MLRPSTGSQQLRGAFRSTLILLSLFHIDMLSQNASWSINSLKVYRKQVLSATVSKGSSPIWEQANQSAVVFLALLACVYTLLGY